jgi:hypothetical protein
MCTVLPVFDDEVYNTCQEHQDRDLVDDVHRAEIKIRFSVWVFFAEEVGSNFSKIK